MRVTGYVLILFVLALVAAPFAINPVFAGPCSAQLGYPIIPLADSGQPVTAIIPISATCSTAYGQQLYASASAYDLNSNTSASTVNTILTSVDGGYTFTGQLGFNLPPSTQGHWVQIAVTIFESQSGGQLTTVGEAFPINPGTGQVVTSTVTQSSDQFAPSMGQQPHVFIFAYVAIAAILATVIIVTVGLVVFSRRPTGYYQAPRSY